MVNKKAVNWIHYTETMLIETKAIFLRTRTGAYEQTSNP